ncbi:hypothetical protein VTK56DRAFT_3209 [Thermocarpiscus australiensis]
MEQHGNQDPQSRSQPQTQTQTQNPPAKRRRIGYACDFCRAKKMRCDGERPSCGACTSRRNECVYSPQRTRVSVTQDYVDSLRAQNKALEEKLAKQSRREGPSAYGDSPFPHQSYSTFSRSASEQDSSYEPAAGQYPVSPRSPARPPIRSSIPDGSIPSDDSRGASYRPSTGGRLPPLAPVHQPLEAVAARAPHATARDNGSPGEYYGEASTFSFIAKVSSPGNSHAGPGRDPSGSKTGTSGVASGWAPQDALPRPAGLDRPALGVHSDLLAASSPSTVVFEDLLGAGGGGAGGGGGDPFELPQRQMADKLVASFFHHRHILNPYLHEGTFRRRYERLWMSQEAGGEEATSANVVWLGLVNMVFAFGSEHVAPRPQASSTAPLPDRNNNNNNSNWQQRNAPERDRGGRFFRRAKTLVLSGILQTGKIELVQALLLLAHYLHGSLELNHCWTVVGLAVRTAQELGLYLDPARTTADVVEQEIHKRVWWGCFALDRLISTKLGRPPVIHDGPPIRVDLPLPVDDEYLTEQAGYRQPEGVPSKLEFFRFIVSHCRLVERVLNVMFKNGGGSGNTNTNTNTGEVPPPEQQQQQQQQQASGSSKLRSVDPQDLLAMSIQLDGALTAWQEGLPAHLRPESESAQWAFQRQRSVLLMRSLHLRLLIHRQTLLLYISRPVTDPFVLELMLPCIKRCVLAASESITQMRFLRQQNALSSFWHNSHYIFAALGVLLVFQKIDPQFRAEVGVPESVDLDELIGQGLEILQRVGGEMHPLAARYVQSFEQLRARLQSTTIKHSRLLLRVREPAAATTTTTTARVATPWATGTESRAAAEGAAGGGEGGSGSGSNHTHGGYAEDSNSAAQTGADFAAAGHDANSAFLLPAMDDELAMLQSVLLDGGEWPGFAELDWQG